MVAPLLLFSGAWQIVEVKEVEGRSTKSCCKAQGRGNRIHKLAGSRLQNKNCCAPPDARRMCNQRPMPTFAGGRLAESLFLLRGIRNVLSIVQELEVRN